MSDRDGQMSNRDADVQTLIGDLPRGVLVTEAREQTLPARTWVKVGADGVEIYLDADQDARLLVRKVTSWPPDPSPAVQNEP